MREMINIIIMLSVNFSYDSSKDGFVSHGVSVGTFFILFTHGAISCNIPCRHAYIDHDGVEVSKDSCVSMGEDL